MTDILIALAALSIVVVPFLLTRGGMADTARRDAADRAARRRHELNEQCARQIAREDRERAYLVSCIREAMNTTR